MQRYAFEHAAAGFLERRIKLAEGFSEARNFGGPDIRGHEFRERMPIGQLAADMPEFLEIVDLGVLGLLRAERRVTARAATAGDVIGALHLVGQSEEILRQGFCPVDQFLRDTVIADDGEAVFAKAAPQVVGNGLERLCQRHNRDIGVRIGHNGPVL